MSTPSLDPPPPTAAASCATAPSATPPRWPAASAAPPSELGPLYACPECFGPLEIAYDFPAVTREQIEAGPSNIWRYQALLPVPDDIAESPNMEPGFTRLLRADNLGRELGIDTLWVKDDSTNPTNSFKDRVVAVRAERGARVRQQGLRLPVHRQPGQRGRRGRRAGRASRPSCSSPATSSSPSRSTRRSTPTRWSP